VSLGPIDAKTFAKYRGLLGAQAERRGYGSPAQRKGGLPSRLLGSGAWSRDAIATNVPAEASSIDSVPRAPKCTRKTDIVAAEMAPALRLLSTFGLLALLSSGLGARQAPPAVPPDRPQQADASVDRAATAGSRGAIVERVVNELAAARAGIRAGDTLTAWERSEPRSAPQARSGRIDSPFDLMNAEAEYAPRGSVTIIGTRGGQPFTAVLARSPWGLETRPDMSDAVLSAYRLRDRLRAATAAERDKDYVTACWLWLVQGRYGEALRASRLSGQPLLTVMVFSSGGMTAHSRDDLDSAVRFYRDAIAAHTGLPTNGLALASLHLNLGVVLWRSGKLAEAVDASTEALSLLSAVVPGSLQEGEALNNLGLIAAQQGQLDRAEDLHRRALAIRRTFIAGGPMVALEIARSLKNIGTIRLERGDLSGAEARFSEALQIRETLAPEGNGEVAATLESLGNIAASRGHLVVAEQRYQRAHAMFEKLAKGRESLSVAQSLMSLGNVADKRGDLETAAGYYERSRHVQEKLAPGSLALANVLGNLGDTAQGRGDPAGAERYYRQALTIREREAPNSPDHASSLRDLGSLESSRGDPLKAIERYTQALQIEQRIAPGGLSVASTLLSLGRVTLRIGRLAEAEKYTKAALAIVETRVPESLEAAVTLHNLALVMRRTRRPQAASNYFARAVAALESQTRTLGGAEELRSEFTAGYATYYQDYIELLVEQKQYAKAFHTLERSRARSLLAMLAERDLLFAPDLPADIGEERRTIDSRYDRVLTELGNLDDSGDRPAARRGALVAELRTLRDRREAIAAKVRQLSPRFAALQYPQPLELRQVQPILDPGTILMSYAVGDTRTVLFVVSSSPKTTPGASLAVFTLPIGRQALAADIMQFRSVLRDADESAAARDRVVESGGRLYRALVSPAASQLARSTRVLIAPSGPLNLLPFAALVEKQSAGTPRYFVEARPLHVILSATLYAELKSLRRPPAPEIEMAAFGDPRYAPVVETTAGAGSVEAEVARDVSRGCDGFRRIKESRAEVESIASRFDSRRTYLGETATEENAKAVMRRARYLHFATHGCLDEDSPLNSALVLSAPVGGGPAAENGLLQVWEIFEQLRTDAELVTLSACETGLGKDQAGEGIVGLTRAFLYAGAHSVLASLWSVDDRSTAELMTRFYRHLAAGKSKDDALREAQIELIRSGSGATFSTPFHWAGFVLHGNRL